MVLGMVGAQAPASAFWVMAWPASNLLTGERKEERNTTKATTPVAVAKATAIHTERLGLERVRGGDALVRFFRFMHALAKSATALEAIDHANVTNVELGPPLAKLTAARTEASPLRLPMFAARGMAAYNLLSRLRDWARSE